MPFSISFRWAGCRLLAIVLVGCAGPAVPPSRDGVPQHPSSPSAPCSALAAGTLAAARAPFGTLRLRLRREAGGEVSAAREPFPPLVAPVGRFRGGVAFAEGWGDGCRGVALWAAIGGPAERRVLAWEVAVAEPGRGAMVWRDAVAVSADGDAGWAVRLALPGGVTAWRAEFAWRPAFRRPESGRRAAAGLGPAGTGVRFPAETSDWGAEGALPVGGP